MGRGRPKGSKTKVKEEIITKTDTIISIGNIKDLRRQIRELKKLKLQCRAGTKERIDLHRQIKGLKKQLVEAQKNIERKAEVVIVDNKKYEQRYFTGYLSKETIERFKRDFGIEFINKDNIRRE